MVERVRITPSSIILKDASGNIKFDTSLNYLKTDPNGTLKAGGYLKAPSVYGQNTLANNDNGWFMTSLVTGGINTFNPSNNTQPLTGIYPTYYYTAKYDQIKMMYTPITSSQWGPYYDNWQTLYFTNEIGVVSVAGSFRYRGWVACIDEDGSGNYPMYPYVDVEVANVVQQTTSGYWTFGYASKQIHNWLWLFDPGGGYAPYNRSFNEAFYTSGKGGSYYYRHAAYRPWGIMTLRNPVNLSISVTP